MVVGLALAVDEVDVEAADVEIERVAIDEIRPRRAVRKEAAGARHVVSVPAELPELPLVDDAVVAVGHGVTVEAVRHVLVAHDAWARLPAVLGIGDERAATADVVHVPVRVDDAVEAVAAPPAHGFDNAVAAGGVAGVESDEAVVRLEQDAVGERLDHGDPVVDVRKLVVDAG